VLGGPGPLSMALTMPRRRGSGAAEDA